MNSQIAITLLKDLEQSLDDYCELNDEGKTAFSMAITALELFGISEQLPSVHPELSNNSPELDIKSGEFISRQEAIRIASGYCHPANIVKELKKLPFVQTTRKIWCEKCYWSDEKGGSIYCRAWNRYTPHSGFCHQYEDMRGKEE